MDCLTASETLTELLRVLWTELHYQKIGKLENN